MACLALEEVLHAMARHHRVANVQAKGLIVLGVLGQAGVLLCYSTSRNKGGRRVLADGHAGKGKVLCSGLPAQAPLVACARITGLSQTRQHALELSRL